MYAVPLTVTPCGGGEHDQCLKIGLPQCGNCGLTAEFVSGQVITVAAGEAAKKTCVEEQGKPGRDLDLSVVYEM